MPTRDELGRMVREMWIDWAQSRSNPKPSWLVPYDDLPESDKEADRVIGQRLYNVGYRDGRDWRANRSKAD